MYKIISKGSLPLSARFIYLLALSQLTVGLYEFGVTVAGDEAQGEGYVNVTVKPGECENPENDESV